MRLLYGGHIYEYTPPAVTQGKRIKIWLDIVVFSWTSLLVVN